MDTISHILKTFRLRARVFHNAKYCGAFKVDTSKEGLATFHIVTAGRCMLELPDSETEPETLEAGDLVLLPRARRHCLVDRLDTACGINEGRSTPFPDAPVETGTGLVCGYLEFDQPSNNPLLDALPDVAIVRSDTAPWDRHLLPLLRILIAESISSMRGAEVTLNRLCDVVFVLLVREYLEQNSEQGLGAALADQRIGRSLDAIHTGLEQEWSVEALASIAAMSRAAFSSRFKELLGETPMGYVTRCRMQGAHRLLRDGGVTIANISERCGYASEAAFAKAFKREMGASPGSVRRGSD
ncbi:MAG: AraC family transcriptional regulator [Gammaproteobacteria bacterium]